MENGASREAEADAGRHSGSLPAAESASVAVGVAVAQAGPLLAASGMFKHPDELPVYTPEELAAASSKAMRAFQTQHNEQVLLLREAAKIARMTPGMRTRRASQSGSLEDLYGAPAPGCSCFSTAHQAAVYSLSVNVALLIIKVVATVASGSLSVLSSVIDSALDLFSGLVLWITSRAVRRRNPYMFPVGRTRLEPVAIIITAAVMATAAFTIILRSIEAIANDDDAPKVDTTVIVLLGVTIGAKLVLWLLCRRIPNPSSSALAVDHANDTVSNSIVLIMVFISTEVWKLGDAVGAIVVALFIIYNWLREGRSHVRNLAGRGADPAHLSQLTWLAANNDSRIEAVDTVRAFHFGNQYIAEVDIVLPPTMQLGEAHDIGADLQMKIELLPSVERAFVHLDVDSVHRPEMEHVTTVTTFDSPTPSMFGDDEDRELDSEQDDDDERAEQQAAEPLLASVGNGVASAAPAFVQTDV